ncbi:MAG: hypothetical protein J6M06_01065 [Synergistaceae bacterium]|nr:hypothetical protein [Synergistaceae bacterium]
MTDIEKKISEFISMDKNCPIEVHLDTVLTSEEVRHLENVMEEKTVEESFEAGANFDLGAPAAPEITIPIAAYAQLLRAQICLDMLRTAYSRNVDSWRYEGLLSLMFGPKEKTEDD